MMRKLLAGVLFATLLLTAQNLVLAQNAQVIGASYFQSPQETEDASTEKLLQEMEIMQLRLRELENDLERKLESIPDAENNEKAHEGFDERIVELEEIVVEQSESIDLLSEADKGFILPGINGGRNMRIFGRIQLDYWAFADHDDEVEAFEGGDPQDRFIFRRLRLGTSGNLTNNVFYKYEGEFAGGNDVLFRDAYIGVQDLPFLNTVIIGNQKRPYGLDNLNSSTNNVFSERPFIIEALNEDARRLGIASYGVSEDQKYNWRYGIFNQRLIESTNGFIGDHYQLEAAGRLAATPWYDESSGGRGWLHVAASASIGFPDGRGGVDNAAQFRTRPEAQSDNRWIDTGLIEGANVSTLGGLEASLNVGAWNFTAEYQGINIERSAGFGDSLKFHGGYIYAAYMLTGEHQEWNRRTGTLGRVRPFENFFAVRDRDSNVQRGMGAWQVAARYSYADFNDDDINGGLGNSLTLGLNWWWSPYTRWQFNYIAGEIDDPDVGTGNYDIFGIRFAVDF